MTNGIKFSEIYEQAVVLHDDAMGELGKGTLVFGGSKWPSFTFDSLFASTKLTEGSTFPILKAKTPGGDCFTLFDCKFAHFYIHADYVVDGDVNGCFKEIEIRYSDISEWFMWMQRLDGELGKSLTWVNHPKPLNATVTFDNENFSLESKVISECSHKGEDYLIHEHVLFGFVNLGSSFGAKDIRSKPLELLALLSILTAYPLSIISVWIKEESGRFHSAYFPAYKTIARDTSSLSNRCFISKPAVDDKWQTIVDNYYKSPYRNISWVRLSGMQRYEGFWEYEALGYVSMLDKYVSQHAKGQVAKQATPLTEKLTSFQEGLKVISPALTDEQCQGVVALAEKKFTDMRAPNFSKKYQHAMNSSDVDVIKIINISEDDFKLIKRVRDKVAHGDAIDFLGNDVSAVSGVVSKIALLLTYWAFRDFGFTPHEFISCMSRTHNSLVLSSHVDRVHLARVTRSATFYTISSEEFDKISGVRGIKTYGCFTQDSEGLITHSEKYTAMHRAWLDENRGQTGIIQPEEIFGLDKDRIEFSGMAYMECESRRLELHHTYVINDS